MYKSLTVAVALSIAAATPGFAQRQVQIQMDSATRALIATRTLRVGSTIVVIDPKTNSAVLPISNPGTDTINAQVSLEFGYAVTDSNGGLRNNVVAAPDANAPSIVSWIRSLPQSITLAPNTSDSLKITVEVPKDLKDGEYWARLVTLQPAVPMQLPAISEGERTMVNVNLNLRSEVDLLYRKGPASSGVDISNGRTAILPGDSLATYCVDLSHSGTVGALAALRISLFKDTTEVFAANTQITIHYPVKPCFLLQIKGLAPGDYTARLTFTERQNIPDNARVEFKAASADAKLVIPAPQPAQ